MAVCLPVRSSILTYVIIQYYKHNTSHRLFRGTRSISSSSLNQKAKYNISIAFTFVVIQSLPPLDSNVLCITKYVDEYPDNPSTQYRVPGTEYRDSIIVTWQYL